MTFMTEVFLEDLQRIVKIQRNLMEEMNEMLVRLEKIIQKLAEDKVEVRQRWHLGTPEE